MLHLFQQDGRFEPQAIAAMSEAYKTAIKELDDTGQPKLVLEIIAERIIASASIGERDPVRLRVAALPWLNRERY
jgi:hypothetical protein